MKNATFTTLLLLSVTMLSNAQKETYKLENIQSKLNWQTPKDSLTQFIKSMEELKKSHSNPYINYWEAYAIYTLHIQVKDGDNKKAEQLVDQGIKLLEEIKNKNSEHYALLALFQGLELNYASSLTIPFKAATNESTARKAIKLDPNNLRAYFALALKDYYTPKMFGGGKIVEENLTKAISLNDRSDENPYAPDWGKPDAYRYLIKFYKKNEQPDKARKLMEEAVLKYPNDKGLIALQAKL
jgi:tetratricopeptide (TPR) repeat protein